MYDSTVTGIAWTNWMCQSNGVIQSNDWIASFAPDVSSATRMLSEVSSSGDALYNKLTWYATPHYTMVFNTFIFLQIFNLLNCRKIDESFNFFSGILDNPVYIFVWIFIVIIQVILGQWGGIFFSCYRLGLSPSEWLVCIGLGLCAIPISFIGKLIVFY